jgi:hypothetical protein
MRAVCGPWISSGLVFVWLGMASAGAQTRPPRPDAPENPPPLDGPVTDLVPLPTTTSPPGEEDHVTGQQEALQHDALDPPSEQGKRSDPPLHVLTEPPPLVAERPSSRRPSLKARWVPGYWEWDSKRAEFVWIGGLWHVPPSGTVWVPPRWERDREGWHRVQGYWAARRDRRAVRAGAALGDRPAWQITGPPADHPVDAPGPAPGPDFFYVAGHHMPDGDPVSWKSGFWARMQPGWDWVPARWVRRAEGWEFRPGYWTRDRGALAGGDMPRRRTAARPVPDGAPPAADVLEPPPASAIGEDDPQPPPSLEDDRDELMRGDEILPGRGMLREEPAFLGPFTGMPYYMIRPPGSFPYGPGGVVVPGAVPPFVRRILDRVLP